MKEQIQTVESKTDKDDPNHKFGCVGWRGVGGEIGKCIYCGKIPDAITQYYSDRLQSGRAAKSYS